LLPASGDTGRRTKSAARRPGRRPVRRPRTRTRKPHRPARRWWSPARGRWLSGPGERASWQLPEDRLPACPSLRDVAGGLITDSKKARPESRADGSRRVPAAFAAGEIVKPDSHSEDGEDADDADEIHDRRAVAAGGRVVVEAEEKPLVDGRADTVFRG